jgi:hypothetical protein
MIHEIMVRSAHNAIKSRSSVICNREFRPLCVSSSAVAVATADVANPSKLPLTELDLSLKKGKLRGSIF